MSNQSRRNFLKWILGLLGLAILPLPGAIRPPKPKGSYAELYYTPVSQDQKIAIQPVGEQVIKVSDFGRSIAYDDEGFVSWKHYKGKPTGPEYGKLESVRLVTVNQPKPKSLHTKDRIPFYRRYT